MQNEIFEESIQTDRGVVCLERGVLGWEKAAAPWMSAVVNILSKSAFAREKKKKKSSQLACYTRKDSALPIQPRSSVHVKHFPLINNW